MAMAAERDEFIRTWPGTCRGSRTTENMLLRGNGCSHPRSFSARGCGRKTTAIIPRTLERRTSDTRVQRLYVWIGPCTSDTCRGKFCNKSPSRLHCPSPRLDGRNAIAHFGSFDCAPGNLNASPRACKIVAWSIRDHSRHLKSWPAVGRETTRSTGLHMAARRIPLMSVRQIGRQARRILHARYSRKQFCLTVTSTTSPSRHTHYILSSCGCRSSNHINLRIYT